MVGCAGVELTMLAKGSSAWNIFIEFDVLEAAGYVDEPPRLAKSVLVFMF